MTINYLRSYKKNRSGALVVMFVYMVTGTETELADYKAAQGEHYRESDDSEPLYFSNKFVGKSTKLIITAKNKVVPDTSMYDQAASLANQYGGNLGNAIATAYASQLIGHQPAVANPVPQDTTEPPLD